jgi:serine/threonine protein kinase
MMSRRPKKQPTADDEIRRKCCVYARKELDKLFADSLIDHNKISKYPKYDMHELTLGKILGQGSFGLVREIKAIHIIQGSSHNNNNNTTKQSTRRGGGNRRVSDKSLLNTSRHRPPPLIDEEVEFGDMESKCFIAHHCLRQDGDARYAVKTLRPQLHEDNIPKFLQGILDMGIEAKVLSDVEHPNIIKLRALSTCEPCAQGFFIVMVRYVDS